MTKNSNLAAAVIVAGIATANTALGRPASAWREERALNFLDTILEDSDESRDAVHGNGKPVFVVEITETSRREFHMEARRMKGNGQVAEVLDSIDVGMFGRDLRKSDRTQERIAAEREAREAAKAEAKTEETVDA